MRGHARTNTCETLAAANLADTIEDGLGESIVNEALRPLWVAHRVTLLPNSQGRRVACSGPRSCPGPRLLTR